MYSDLPMMMSIIDECLIQDKQSVEWDGEGVGRHLHGLASSLSLLECHPRGGGGRGEGGGEEGREGGGGGREGRGRGKGGVGGGSENYMYVNVGGHL